MAYFVIIRGPAAVGKTTISKLLAEKINAEVISFDKIMRELNLDYCPGEKWIPLDKFLKADKIKIPEFIEKLESGTLLIIDGNFYHKEHIQDLVDNLPFQHFVFTLKADLNECIKRDKHRINSIGNKAINAVFDLVSVFDYGIIIDTNEKTPPEIVEEIIYCLNKKM